MINRDDWSAFVARINPDVSRLIQWVRLTLNVKLHLILLIFTFVSIDISHLQMAFEILNEVVVLHD